MLQWVKRVVDWIDPEAPKAPVAKRPVEKAKKKVVRKPRTRPK